MTKARKDLDDAIKTHEPPLTDAEKKSFKDNETKFEDRAKADHLTPEQVAQTYEQTAKLLKAKNGKVADGHDRVILAEDVMKHAADPTTVKQGQHETCNMTTVAQREYTRDPAKMAEMVTTTALTGEWKAPDGKTIKIDNQSLVPGKSERNENRDTNERSYATQITNVVMMNDVTQRREPPQYYAQGPAGAGDNGERIYNRFNDPSSAVQQTVTDSHGHQTTTPMKRPDVTNAEIAAEAQRLSGGREFYLNGSNQGNGNGTFHARTQEEFEQHLKQMKDQHQFPGIVTVDSGDQPIGCGGQGSPNDHVVCVTGYDEKNHTVEICDPADGNSKRWVKAEDLYKNSGEGDTTNVDKKTQQCPA